MILHDVLKIASAMSAYPLRATLSPLFMNSRFFPLIHTTLMSHVQPRQLERGSISSAGTPGPIRQCLHEKHRDGLRYCSRRLSKRRPSVMAAAIGQATRRPPSMLQKIDAVHALPNHTPPPTRLHAFMNVHIQSRLQGCRGGTTDNITLTSHIPRRHMLLR